MILALRFFQRSFMRLAFRIALLSTASAVLLLGTAGIAAADTDKPKPGRANNPHAAEQSRFGAQEPVVVTAAGAGATAQPGGCQTSNPTVTGSGNVVVNPSGATNFTCHGALPVGAETPGQAVKVAEGDCDTVLTPSGRVRTICHSRP